MKQLAIKSPALMRRGEEVKKEKKSFLLLIPTLEKWKGSIMKMLAWVGNDSL